jgi:hypothetical protein
MAGKTRGPKFKLSKDLVARFCGLLEAGVPSTTACAGAGITRETLSDYRRRARAGEPRFIEFAEATSKAIANGRIRLLMQIRKHGARDFRAPAWILEHAHSEEFGTKSQVTFTLNEERSKLLETAQRVLAPSAFAKLLEAFAAEDVAGNGSAQAGRTQGDD